MKIKLKRVYDPPAAEDGVRVLVDRIWPRGVAKSAARIDHWLKEIAPSHELRKWFGHDPGKWAEFREKYRAELRTNSAAVQKLRELVQSAPVTLLFGARNTHQNQAVVLKEFLEEGEN